MNDAHYFRSPEGPFERREISVELAGAQRTVSSAGGIFSPEGIDKGTQVLLREAPSPAPTGDLLDIGCGWGPIALTMALQSPQATVWAVDVNERSRVLCAENAQRLGLENVRVCAPEEVPTGIQFATIWSNPPIRIGKQALHDLLELWLPRLQQPQTGEDPAEAWLVVQKNLGADSLLTWMKSMLAVVGEDFSAERTASSKGFRILRVTRDQVQV